MAEDRSLRSFYRYVVVAAGFIGSGVIWGTYRTYGLFFKSLSSEFGWTSAETSGAFSLAFLLFGVSSIVAGRLSDKIGLKLVFITSGLVLGAGYFLMAGVSSIWELYLFYGVIIGIGMSGIDAPAQSTIIRWFVKKRGMAIGVAKTGTGIGMFILPLLAVWLISSYGWRNAYTAIGIISIAGIMSIGLFLRRGPDSGANLPHATGESTKVTPQRVSRQLTLREVFGTHRFWIYSTIWFILGFSTQIIMVHIAPHVMELGISVTTAASILSVTGAISILGRIAMGSLSDRMGNRLVFIISISLLVVSYAWVLYAREAWMYYLFAVIYGFAHGAVYTLSSPMLAELFGLKSLGAIIGAVVFIGTIGGSIGPYLSGSIFDITGSYRTSFLICLALSIVALVLMAFLRPTRE